MIYIVESRKEETASPQQIMISLENFERKWKLCDNNGWKVVNEECLSATEEKKTGK